VYAPYIPRTHGVQAKSTPSITNHTHTQAISEAQAADATGNFRGIARRLVAAAAAAAAAPEAPGEDAAGGGLRRSYSSADGAHSFNYLIVPAPSSSGPFLSPTPLRLLFLCLSDAGSTTRESFHFLEARVYGGVYG